MKSRSPRFETILYLLAFLLALGLRFARLGEPALTDSEARLALDALQIAQGAQPALSPHIAYTNLTAVLFFVFGSFNFLARFWPALAGSVLVLVPWLFRERIKPRPALILAFFLAIDPAFVALSRQAGSPIFAVTFFLLAAGFWICRQPRLAGIFAALTLLSGPALWAGLLGLLLAWMIAQSLSARPKLEETEHVHTYTGTQVDTDTGMQVDTFEEDVTPTSHLASPISQPLSSNRSSSFIFHLSSFFILTLLATSTLFLLAPQGLSAWLAALPEYILGWVSPVAVPSGRLFLALGVYQPLAILLAVVSIVRGLWNRSRRVIRLSLWMLIALLLAVFYPARQPADLVWMLIPLWTLAALEFARYIDFAREDRFEMLGVFAFTVLLLGFAWMNFIALYWTPIPSPQGNIRLGLFFGALVLLIVSVVLVGYGWSQRVARVGAAWGMMVILGLYTLGAAWGATGLRIQTGVDLWLADVPVHQAELLSQTADQVSEWATGHADDLPVTVFGVDSPALLWALRNHDPKVVLALDPTSAPELVITPPQQELALAAAYRGQDFIWRQTPSWDSLPAFYLRWITYRELPVQGETLILWVRSDLFIDSGSAQP